MYHHYIVNCWTEDNLHSNIQITIDFLSLHINSCRVSFCNSGMPLHAESLLQYSCVMPGASEFGLCVICFSKPFLGKDINSWQNSWANPIFIRKSTQGVGPNLGVWRLWKTLVGLSIQSVISVSAARLQNDIPPENVLESKRKWHKTWKWIRRVTWNVSKRCSALKMSHQHYSENGSPPKICTIFPQRSAGVATLSFCRAPLLEASGGPRGALSGLGEAQRGRICPSSSFSTEREREDGPLRGPKTTNRFHHYMHASMSVNIYMWCVWFCYNDTLGAWTPKIWQLLEVIAFL